jgi:hypothetical protein
MARYANSTADSLLDKARSVTDVGERRQLSAALWRRESKALPLIYPWTTRNVQGGSRKASGFSLLADDGLLRLQDERPAK